MELQFQKTEISCLRQLADQVLNQEQTVEVRLDDTMPEIGRVLGAWGQVVLRGKEWRSNNVQVTGGVMAWVLYVPEDGGPCRSVEAWLPFQWKADIPPLQRDGTVIANALLRSVDARSLSAKKLMVRANVSLHLQIMMPDQVQMYKSEEVPEDVQLRKQTLPVQIPTEAGEKPFVIDEVLPLPEGSEPMEKIMYMRLQPALMDRKVMADKVVFRGAGILHMLYLGTDGKLYTCDLEMPFAQYGELTGQYGEDAQTRIRLAVTSLEVTPNQEGKLQINAGLTGQYVIYDRPCLEIICDAYSTQRNAEPKFEQVQLPVILDMFSQTVPCQAQLQADAMQVVDTVILPEHPGKLRTDDGMCLEIAGQVQMLYYTKDGSLDVTSGSWSGQSVCLAAQDCGLESAVTVSGNAGSAVEGDTLATRADILLDTVCLAAQGLRTMGALELSDGETDGEEKPSLILRRAGQESLWDMAKATGSTVAAIKAANDLTEEPTADCMLIIPVG